MTSRRLALLQYSLMTKYESVNHLTILIDFGVPKSILSITEHEVLIILSYVDNILRDPGYDVYMHTINIQDSGDLPSLTNIFRSMLWLTSKGAVYIILKVLPNEKKEHFIAIAFKQTEVRKGCLHNNIVWYIFLFFLIY